VASPGRNRDRNRLSDAMRTLSGVPIKSISCVSVLEPGPGEFSTGQPGRYGPSSAQKFSRSRQARIEAVPLTTADPAEGTERNCLKFQ
jgi:hypothetical protein